MTCSFIYMSTATKQATRVSRQALGGVMFHTTALFTPATGYERISSEIEQVEKMLLSRKGRFYFAGRDRTRREWMTWLEFARKRVAA